LAQEKQIERDIANRIKLIGDKTDLTCLLREYPDEDIIYQDKIKVYNN